MEKIKKEQGYQIPEAFQFNGIQIPGYWLMKYTAGDIITYHNLLLMV